MSEFKYPQKHANLLALFLFPFFSMCVVGFFSPLFPSLHTFYPQEIWMHITNVVFFILMILLYVFFKSVKLNISKYSIIKTTIFNKREIPIKDIKGIKITPGGYGTEFAVIYSVNKQEKPIKFDNYIKDYKQIVNWLQHNFIDLNIEEQERIDAIQIEHLAEKGITDFSGFKFKAFDYLSHILNTLSLIIPIISLFYYNNLVIISIMALPIAAIALNRISGNYIVIEEGLLPTAKFNSVLVAFMLPTICLPLLIIFSNVLEYGSLNFWLCSVSLTVLVVFALINSLNILNKSTKIWLTIFFHIYCLSSSVLLNVVLDTNQPTPKTCIITEKTKENHSVIVFYSLKVMFNDSSTTSLSVSKSEYNKYNPNDSLKINIKPGFFNMRWVSSISE
jgi:hypothetical protein